MEYATLNNGLKMPMAGIGTFLLTPDEAEASVLAALEDGYRLIDTANAYVNEKAVGRAMKKSGLKREEIFLETKLWPSFYEDDNAVDKTLKRLGTEYIDCLLYTSLHQVGEDVKSPGDHLLHRHRIGVGGVHQGEAGVELRIVPPGLDLLFLVGNDRPAVALAAGTCRGDDHSQGQGLHVDDAGPLPVVRPNVPLIPGR